MAENTSADQNESRRPKFKRFHQVTSGIPRPEYGSYDDYADVREACERKLKEWADQGILLPWQSVREKDWLFG